MAIPGVFQPVELNGRILVDGGGMNPLPFDLLRERCDLVVAVDVSGMLEPPENPMPGALEAVVGMFQVMSRSMVEARLEHAAPDLLLRPTIKDVRVLEFQKAESIYAGAMDEATRLREWLAQHAS
jgi:NTE family protein